MSVDVLAELSAPNDAYTFTYDHTYVRVDENKIKHDIIDAWRNWCAAQFCKEANDQSCIIDGIPFGPPPTSKASWNFVTSRPYVIKEEFSDDEGQKPFPSNARWEKVHARLRIGYKWTPASKAVWRPYPEVEAEQRGFLWTAIDNAIHGRQALRQEGTVTFPDGRPKSA